MSELIEGIEIANEIAGVIKEAAQLWESYKAGKISAVDVRAKIAAGRAVVAANRATEDKAIADYEAKFDTTSK